jgi:hypothetical protein
MAPLLPELRLRKHVRILPRVQFYMQNVQHEQLLHRPLARDHWHPARVPALPDASGEGAAAGQVLPMDTISQMRTTLLITPMSWVYSSSLMDWVPTRQQQRLRRAIRAQQQLVTEAGAVSVTGANDMPPG